MSLAKEPDASGLFASSRTTSVSKGKEISFGFCYALGSFSKQGSRGDEKCGELGCLVVGGGWGEDARGGIFRGNL